MKKLSKENVIKTLENEIANGLASENKRDRYNARLDLNLLSMIKNVDLKEYKNMAYTQNGNLNRGYIMEDLVLSFKNELQENNYLEIKYCGANTPNILINNDTRLVYIVINKSSNVGAYTIRNMSAIRNKRLTLNYLLDNDLLTPCKALNEYLGI